LEDQTDDHQFTQVRYGVSAEFRNSSDPHDNQEDQALTDADLGKARQNLRKSATRRNQDSDKG
jgi:hypothetical protein